MLLIGPARVGAGCRPTQPALPERQARHPRPITRGRSVEPRSGHRPLQGTAHRRRTKQAARLVREQAGELGHGNALNSRPRPPSVRCRRQWCKVSFKSHAQNGAERLHRSACQRYGNKLNHPPLFPLVPGGPPSLSPSFPSPVLSDDIALP